MVKICPNMSGISHEYLRTFYCYRRRHIAIKTLYSSEMVSGCYQSRGDTETMRMRHNVTLYIHYPILLQFMYVYYFYILTPEMLPRLVSQRYVSSENFGKDDAELGHCQGSAVQERLKKTDVFCVTSNGKILSE